MKKVRQLVVKSVTHWGTKDWADEQLRYLLGLFGDNSTWNLGHNWYCKLVVAGVIIDRLKEVGFEWHHEVGSGHFHRWLARKSWGGSV